MKVISEWKKVLEQDLEYIGDEIRDLLGEGRSCILLTGEVGAGKTTFIQHFMKKLNGGDEVLSPTYSVIHEQGEYAHGDFYRIEDAEEIVHLEMGLYAEGKRFFLIEWGMPFIKEIQLQIGEHFQFFEMKIEITNNDKVETSSRNIKLIKL